MPCSMSSRLSLNAAELEHLGLPWPSCEPGDDVAAERNVLDRLDRISVGNDLQRLGIVKIGEKRELLGPVELAIVDLLEPAHISLEHFAALALERGIIDPIEAIGARFHIGLEQAVPCTVVNGLRRPDSRNTQQGRRPHQRELKSVARWLKQEARRQRWKGSVAIRCCRNPRSDLPSVQAILRSVCDSYDSQGG